MTTYFNRSEIEHYLTYQELVPRLKEAFADDYIVPPRSHHSFQSGAGEEDSTMLLMPAWRNRHHVGLKVITVSPHNSLGKRPTIQGTYLLINAVDGELIAQFDAAPLTNIRTAATSALAADFLAVKHAESLLMIGTGALAPEMIRAHCSVRDVKKIWIWGRDFQKSRSIADSLEIENVELTAIRERKRVIGDVDIISSATSSPTPLIFGNELRPGQHIDLVGAFKPTWREADDQAIQRSSVFVDTRQGALKEAGEVLIPISKGIFSKDDISGDLFDLCGGVVPGRSSNDTITSFVSVGYALEDLVAAELVWENYCGA